MSHSQPWWIAVIFMAALFLAGCGGGGGDGAAETFSVGGTVTGLSGTLVLQDNGGDDLSIAADGSFTFATPIASGSSYSVTVLTQPSGQNCVVGNGSGTATATVTDAAVTCGNLFSIGGAVTGLSGTLVLQNNGGDDITITADGAFTFTTALEDAADYSVTIGSEPGIQRCSVSNGGGALAGANVTGVSVSCLDQLFFAADDGSTGRELWKSDGTSAGTVFIADVYPGSALNNGDPSQFTTIDGTVFFVANIGGAPDNELWKTDGTAAGTSKVKAINALEDDVDNLVKVGSLLFFTADDGSTGIELYTSDGSTVTLLDINTGVGSSSPQDLTNVNGTLFFRASDSGGDNELWKSDGTKLGTMRVADINTGGSSFPQNLTDVNGTLFFSAIGSGTDRELWKSDGTTPGTMPVADINAGGSSFPANLTNVNGTLFFSANDGSTGTELYTSDGSTVTLLDINSGGSSFPANLTAFNGILLFAATDAATGKELWRSDGGAVGTGTVIVKDINPVGASGSFPQNLTNVNGTLFFSADVGSATTGSELWKSDGDPATASGTALVKDIFGGPSGSNITVLGVHGGLLLFQANDGIKGLELWKSDGTLAGTMIVKDINTGAASGL